MKERRIVFLLDVTGSPVLHKRPGRPAWAEYAQAFEQITGVIRDGGRLAAGVCIDLTGRAARFLAFARDGHGVVLAAKLHQSAALAGEDRSPSHRSHQVVFVHLDVDRIPIRNQRLIGGEIVFKQSRCNGRFSRFEEHPLVSNRDAERAFRRQRTKDLLSGSGRNQHGAVGSGTTFEFAGDMGKASPVGRNPCDLAALKHELDAAQLEPGAFIGRRKDSALDSLRRLGARDFHDRAFDRRQERREVLCGDAIQVELAATRNDLEFRPRQVQIDRTIRQFTHNLGKELCGKCDLPFLCVFHGKPNSDAHREVGRKDFQPVFGHPKHCVLDDWIGYLGLSDALNKAYRALQSGLIYRPTHVFPSNWQFKKPDVGTDSTPFQGGPHTSEGSGLSALAKSEPTRYHKAYEIAEAGDMLTALLGNPIGLAFLVIAVGCALGEVRIRGISGGSSMVLFVALVFGHFGYNLPVLFRDLGVILFVYAVGLQAGPRFISTFRSQGMQFLGIGLVTILAGAITAALTGWVFGLEPAYTLGIFSGAMTSTPALAASLDTLGDPAVSVAYGIAYPFGVIGVVLFVQILPRWMERHAPRPMTASEPGSSPSRPSLTARRFVVENPAAVGKSVSEIDIHSLIAGNLSRIQRGDQVFPAAAGVVLEQGDIVLAVGTVRELDKLALIFGPEDFAEVPQSQDVIARDVYVSETRVAGMTLSELRIGDQFGVIVTRVNREDLEFVPTGSFRFEIGDLVRIVGRPSDCDAFIAFAGKHEKRIHETPILPFSIGIVLGIALAYAKFTLPGGMETRLGLAGGPLLVGLALGYLGRVGPLGMRTPYAVRYLLRELGLVFFLAGAGIEAGGDFLGVVQSQGPSLLLAGILITVIPMVVAIAFSRSLYGFSLEHTLGAVCGGMTSTPGLGVACKAMDSDEPAVAYAAVYPVALIAVTLAAQILCLIL